MSIPITRSITHLSESHSSENLFGQICEREESGGNVKGIFLRMEMEHAIDAVIK